MSGTYIDTKVIDGNWGTFREESSPPKYRLDVNGTFIIDLSTYSLSLIHTIEVQMRYRASDTLEKWYLKAYNWVSNTYSDSGFNNTLGHTSGNWDYYAIKFTDEWRDYVQDDGAMIIKLHDEKMMLFAQILK